MLPIVNQTLQFRLNSIDEEEAKIEYKSRISDVAAEIIAIEVPLNVKNGRLKKLYVGDEISASYVSKDGVVSYFMSSVIGFKEDVIPLVIIKKPTPDSITTVQRRGFLRMPATLEIAVKYTEQLRFVAMTVDVGGGGVSFLFDNYIPLTTPHSLSCWLLVPFKNGTIEHVPFVGELVRVKATTGEKHLAMVRFTEIHDRDRQKIIRYCFERQLDFRKR